MALILEDGTGLEDANAYADVALADTLLVSFGTNLDNWNPASVGDKETPRRIV